MPGLRVLFWAIYLPEIFSVYTILNSDREWSPQFFSVDTVLSRSFCRRLFLFSVGAFFFKDKSPTITVTSFFSSDNRMYAKWTLFTELLNYCTGKRVSLSFTAFLSPKSPLHILIICNKLDFQKTQMAPPLTISKCNILNTFG